MNKKIVMMTAMALAATVAFAAPRTSKKPAVSDEDAPTTGKEAKIMLDQFPKLGRQSTLPAPSLQGGSIVGKCYTKPRSWIVLEAKYTTFVKWQDQLHALEKEMATHSSVLAWRIPGTGEPSGPPSMLPLSLVLRF